MKNSRRAFVLADAILAMTLLAAMSVVLVTAVSHQQRGSQRLADSRRAAHYAEQMLINLQQGQPVPPAPANIHATLQPAPGDQSITGFSWARVTVQCNEDSASVYGLVKAPGESKP